MKTFAIHTLGCKVNSYESEAYIEKCLELGYQQVDFKEKSDIYLINTCAVTNTAASKSRQKIHQAISLNPSAFIAVIGCYSQSQSEEIEKMEGVDVVVGSDHKDEFLMRLDEMVTKHQKVNFVKPLPEKVKFEDLSIHRFSAHTRAFLKVQDGCNQFCSYCIIPYTRGRERSLELNKVVKTAKRFVENGHREIVLAGIHTGRYGKDIGLSLVDLLKSLLRIEGLERIRISSIEMNEITDELIELMKHEKRIARHLHIPVQSCSTSVLEKMHRPYSIEEFMQRVEEIRKQLPMISISTDIIAGFPEESDANHETTLINCDKIAFSFMHVFPYSKRDHTLAGNMKQVHGTIKKQRASELNQRSFMYKENYYRKWLNQECEVIVEKCHDGMCFGYSSEYIPVRFHGDETLLGFCVKVKIIKTSQSECLGMLEE